MISSPLLTSLAPIAYTRFSQRSAITWGEIFEWSLVSVLESMLFVVLKFEVSTAAMTGLDSC